jgi:regulator of sirC expression with transglutaminase-like and TPR domain
MKFAKPRKPRTPRPRDPARYPEQLALRVDAELLAAIDSARGKRGRAEWIRDVLEQHALTSDLRAVREVIEYATRRGVTREMMAAALPLLAGD